MPRGTLGDTSGEEISLRRNTRNRYSDNTASEFSAIRNPYERPTTSNAARKRGELQMSMETNRVESHRQELSSMPPRGAARRKQKTGRQRILEDLKRIAKLQQSTKLLIPKAPFARVVRQISIEISEDITHYTATALEALHEATEMFITQVLQDAYMLTLHRKCITLSLSDMVLIRALKLSM